MKNALLVVLILLSTSVFAQTDRDRTPMPGFNFETPRALSGQWWRDPEVVNELRLTEAQRKQLEQANLNMKLSLISSAATAASAVVKGESSLNSDQLDEVGYSQQVNAAADAASKLIRDVGATMLSMRKILTAEQWRKLDSMRRPAPQTRRPMARNDERRPAPPQE